MWSFAWFRARRALLRENRQLKSELLDTRIELAARKAEVESLKQSMAAMPAWDALGKAVGLPGRILEGGFDIVVAYLLGRMP